ncbi:MaoC family dehydratase [Tropheryma whipplei]|uniref:MaoC-like domain-containing protein n=2 Tax=Tropheryma whipplei TaxID=2039 RepID=Q83FK3_TROWT|nr:MaoC family dehydratase [Tropheryma whipplei]AAO44817.1 unknown [Tropheryma whipplei str. Twist]MCO8182467.1 MaoC family dehydratase [Tropheryma whipplei]MCO8190311.1 MaoC family dehydratase [Tropheryma whipplei]CAD67394.1 conserved hypothetical protein [Tropheryma whipplei TW08/27]
MLDLFKMPLGSQIFSDTKLVSRDDLVRYAAASGDFNPIHYRDDFARAVGLPGVICHGMLTMALAIAPLMTQLGTDVSRLSSYGVRFSKPVPVPVGKNPLDEQSVGALLSIKAFLRKREDSKAIIELIVSLDDETVLTKAFAEISLKI